MHIMSTTNVVLFFIYSYKCHHYQSWPQRWITQVLEGLHVRGLDTRGPAWTRIWSVTLKKNMSCSSEKSFRATTRDTRARSRTWRVIITRRRAPARAFALLTLHWVAAPLLPPSAFVNAFAFTFFSFLIFSLIKGQINEHWWRLIHVSSCAIWPAHKEAHLE